MERQASALCGLLPGRHARRGRLHGRASFLPAFQLDSQVRRASRAGHPPHGTLLFRVYDYPPHYRYSSDEEKSALLLDTRLALRAMLEKDNEGFVYSFWPDTLTLKEIGDPRDIATISASGTIPARCSRGTSSPSAARTPTTTSCATRPIRSSSGLHPLRQRRKHLLHQEQGISEVAAPRLHRL